ncbi:hypothetical protein [Bacillus sp. FJAT-44742]|uniref:hypothetical protein n=1 Tax=Bacillus sp. FJAT-44742 TaxID=2014005 RepID=UPI000C24F364|nr:hypothetical protein [Bacillus sp. FJAT-44742]
MGVVGFCLVTVEITAIDGVDLIEPIVVFEEQSFPSANGTVTFEVFGEEITVPCPTEEPVEETIEVAGIGVLTLQITAEEGA